MTVHSMDEDLLASASSSHQKKDPDDEVGEIVNSLTHSTYLNPVLEKYLQDPRQKELFLELFARQTNLIKSRSQSFDDSHVTIYDKVLLRLTENGNKFGSAAAQEYFCEEFLGISKDGNPEKAEKILDQNLVLKAILARAANPEDKNGGKYSAESSYGEKVQHYLRTLIPKNKEEDELNNKIARLLSVYVKAKSDYEAVPVSEAVSRLAAARFLRDTAENTIMYFRDPTKSHKGRVLANIPHKDELLADLESTCKMAQASVVYLSGGRKRKFDKHAYETLPRSAKRQEVKASRRQRSPSGDREKRGRSPIKHRRDSQIDTRHRDSQIDTRRRDRRHSSILASPPPPPPKRPSVRRTSRDQHPKRSFGYSRNVDSYHPADRSNTTHAHPPPSTYHQQEHYYRTSPEHTTAPTTIHGYASGGAAYAETSPRYHTQRQAQEQQHGYGGYDHRGNGYGYGYSAYGGGVEREREREREYEGAGRGGGRRKRGGGNGGEGNGYEPPLMY